MNPIFNQTELIELNNNNNNNNNNEEFQVDRITETEPTILEQYDENNLLTKSILLYHLQDYQGVIDFLHFTTFLPPRLVLSSSEYKNIFNKVLNYTWFYLSRISFLIGFLYFIAYLGFIIPKILGSSTYDDDDYASPVKEFELIVDISFICQKLFAIYSLISLSKRLNQVAPIIDIPLYNKLLPLSKKFLCFITPISIMYPIISGTITIFYLCQ
jgi:hypothetical protein